MTIKDMWGNFIGFVGTRYKNSELLSFEGRLSRQEFVGYNVMMGFVILTLTTFVCLAAMLFVFIFRPGQSITEFMRGLSPLLAMGTFASIVGFWLITLSFTVRRLHDFGLSGWYVLLSLIPIVNVYGDYMLYARAGNAGSNRFGPEQLRAEREYWQVNEECYFCNPLDSIQNILRDHFLQAYTSIKGRYSCRQFFMACMGIYIIGELFSMLIVWPLSTLANSMDLPSLFALSRSFQQGWNWLLLLIFLVIAIKRSHDLGLSGWHALLIAVPMLNAVYLFNLFYTSGSYEENEFGAPVATASSTPDYYYNDKY